VKPPRTRRSFSTPPRTRLDRFIRRHRIRPSLLARTAGVTRQHVTRLRRSTGNPTLSAMLALRNACRRITGRRVSVTDLFNLGERCR
jgi:predicted transcriptional regulator